MATSVHDGTFFTQNSNDNWGLARVFSRDNPWTVPRMWSLENQPNTVTFNTFTNVGSGVDVYVLDSGINPDHPEWTGVDSRCIVRSLGLSHGDDAARSHGGNVASVIGGPKYGVAPGVRIISIKVTNNSGFGTSNQVAAGLMEVRSHYSVNSNPALINMSLENYTATGSLTQALINAVAGDGIAMFAAAGNRYEDINSLSATNPYPAAFDNVFVVGATGITDQIMHNPPDSAGNILVRPNFGSNYGPQVDIFAPGACVVGASYLTDNNSLSTKFSGTSQACPHVAGVAALMLGKTGELSGLADVTSLYNMIKDAATVNRVRIAVASTTSKMVYAASAYISV